jgi:hypothetical protein
METVTMEDFESTEFNQWETGAENDAHLILRETPAWKVRERWAQIRLRVHEMALERELALAHITEHLDHSLDFPVPSPQKKTTRFDDVCDKLAVYICRFMHREPNYRRGDQYSVCPTCKRKYAIPFAEWSRLPADVYVASKPFQTPKTPILQCVCKSGTQKAA